MAEKRARVECSSCCHARPLCWRRRDAHCLECGASVQQARHNHNVAWNVQHLVPSPPLVARHDCHLAPRRPSRVRMFCPTCLFESFLERSSEEPHCLKCDTPLKRRTSSQENARVCDDVDGSFAHRLSGEVSTYEQLFLGEWESGHCQQSPTKLHHWKFGKCHYCQQPEGKVAHSPIAVKSGREAWCAKGGKCMFESGRCGKCCRDAAKQQCTTHHSTVPQDPQSPPELFGSIGVDCPTCGWKCFPQWANGKGHCLKCDTLLGNGEEVKQSSGAIGCEHCQQSPDWSHHWKFGKCHYCQKPEGRIMHDFVGSCCDGAFVGCIKGGKCRFKFATCTKCGRREGILLDRHRPQTSTCDSERGHGDTRLEKESVPCTIEDANTGCESAPVGGGFRAVRKLLRGQGKRGSGDEDQRISVGSDDEAI